MAEPTVLAIMDDICDWLRANGIEPNDVPIAAVPDLSSKPGYITCPVHLRRNGRKFLDSRGEVARDSVTVPLKVRPPAALYGWLLGLVPAP